MLYYFSCFGKVPTCNKNQRRFTRLMDTGEEKLKEFINVRYIWSVIEEHHQILKEMNNTGKKLRDRVFDNVIPLSSCDDTRI